MNISGAAKETFQTLLQFDYQLKLYDDDGMVVAEPADARRMFAASPNLLVSLVDADDDSKISLMFGKSTHANDIDGLMQALRSVATKYNMTFEPKQYGKEIDAKDYQHLVSVSESSKDNTMNLMEGMYGTSKTSYLLLDNARLIVHHAHRVGNLKARTRHIDSIFVENASGRRVQFPTGDLAQAMRLAQHISAGGLFEDKIAQAIVEAAMPRRTDGTPVFVVNNSVVREFIEWADSFAPERALREWDDASVDSDGDDAADDESDESDENDAPEQITDDVTVGDHNEVLTREDVLLPSKNQGASLSREVGTAVVHDDPVHPDDEQAPDPSYISRLQTLSGMRSGERY